MKKITFDRTVVSNIPGYEMDYYSSGDIEGSYITPRNCFVAVLEQILNYNKEDLEVVDEFTLEQMLLENDVYVCFEDSYDV